MNKANRAATGVHVLERQCARESPAVVNVFVPLKSLHRDRLLLVFAEKRTKRDTLKRGEIMIIVVCTISRFIACNHYF